MLNLHVVYSLTKEFAFWKMVLGRVSHVTKFLYLCKVTITRKMSVKLGTEALTLESLRNTYLTAKVNTWFNNSAKYMFMYKAASVFNYFQCRRNKTYTHRA